MAADRDPAEHRVVLRHRQSVTGGRACKKAAGEAEGESGFAYPRRPGYQPGVMQPPGAHRVGDRRLGRLMAEQQRIGARLRRHQAPPNRASTAARIAAATGSGAGVPSITTQRPGSRAAMSRNPNRTRSKNSGPRLS